MKIILAWAVTITLAVAATAVLLRQRSVLSQMEAEHLSVEQSLAQMREQIGSAPPPIRSAAAPASDDVSEMENARANLARVREQVALAARDNAARADAPRPPFTPGVLMPAADWQNAGNATPEAALQTVLWAGAGGDIATMARHLRYMTPQAQSAAESLHRNLGDAAAKYQNPLELVAALTVPEIPIASARVRSWDSPTPIPAGATEIRIAHVELYSSAVPKTATLLFIKESGGWKIMVPAEAIQRYAAQLQR